MREENKKEKKKGKEKYIEELVLLEIPLLILESAFFF